MRLMHRPINVWPGKLRAERERIWSPFDVKWPKILHDLEREVRHLTGEADYVVLEMAVEEKDIRLDGQLRAGANPAHPGVILSLESTKVGPLRLWTDRFRDMDGNVRAVSLYLAHQRAAERYGLGTGQEAYQGWKALGPGIALGPATPQTMTYEMAINLIANCSGKDPVTVENYVNACFRSAAAKYHPDVNKDAGAGDIYRQLVDARDLIMKTRGAA